MATLSKQDRRRNASQELRTLLNDGLGHPWSDLDDIRKKHDVAGFDDGIFKKVGELWYAKHITPPTPENVITTDSLTYNVNGNTVTITGKVRFFIISGGASILLVVALLGGFNPFA